MATMTRDEFERLLARRDDSFWELLATAANSPVSVEKTASALQAVVLCDESSPYSSTPSRVQDRVEALAAADVQRLVEVARTWPQIQFLTKSEMVAGTHDLLVAAWSRSIRHLPDDAGVSMSLRSEVPAIRDEQDVRIASCRQRLLRWSDVLRLALHPDATYETFRIQAPTSLEEEAVTRPMMQDLILSGDPGSDVTRLGRARLLRNIRMLLEDDAVSWLQEQLDSQTALDARLMWTHEFCAAAEIARSPAYFGALRSTVSAALVDAFVAREAAPLCYALLERGWRVP